MPIAIVWSPMASTRLRQIDDYGARASRRNRMLNSEEAGDTFFEYNDLVFHSGL